MQNRVGKGCQSKGSRWNSLRPTLEQTWHVHWYTGMAKFTLGNFGYNSREDTIFTLQPLFSAH